MTNVTLNNQVLSHNGFIAKVIETGVTHPPINQIEADFKRLTESFILECIKCCIDIRSYRKDRFTLKENTTRLIGTSNKNHSIDVYTNVDLYPFIKNDDFEVKNKCFNKLRDIALDAIMKLLATDHIPQLLTEYDKGKVSFTFDIKFTQ